jgi:hypothetical protein
MPNVHRRRPGATPSQPASNGHHADVDDAALVPATLGDLADLRAMLEAYPEQPPCWCPDAPGRHERNCHIEALAKFARQWTCRAGGGGLFLPGGIGLECDCPTCRIEAAISAVGAQLYGAISSLELGDMNMNIRRAEEERTPPGPGFHAAVGDLEHARLRAEHGIVRPPHLLEHLANHPTGPHNPTRQRNTFGLALLVSFRAISELAVQTGGFYRRRAFGNGPTPAGLGGGRNPPCLVLQ